MKILVSSSWAPDQGSGISTYAREISEELVRRGHRVTFLSPAPADDTWLQTQGVSHFACSQFDPPLERAAELLQHMRAVNYDLAINNDNAFLQSIAPALSCPLIVIGHCERRSIASLAVFQMHYCDYVVAISNDMQARFILHHRVPVPKCPVVYNGIQPPPLPSRFKQPPGHTLKCVFAGGFSRIKGGDLILRLVLDQKHFWERHRLFWFGTVPPRVRDRLAPISGVHFMGRVPRAEFLKHLESTDLLLMPSRFEGCSMVMLEAMSLGVVPITSDGPGAMGAIIRSGLDGYICPLRRWSAEAFKCVDFLGHHPIALQMLRTEARKRFRSHLSVSRTVDTLLELGAAPTVTRDHPPERIPVLRWHRPLRPDGLKAPFFDRICYRLGILRKAGTLELATILPSDLSAEPGTG